MGSAIPRSDCGVKLVIRELGGQFVPDITLNGVEGVDVVFTCESNGFPLSANPSSAADAVDVVLGVLGEVVVDDVADALDVETTAGDIGSD